jgi:hypothetical protein
MMIRLPHHTPTMIAGSGIIAGLSSQEEVLGSNLLLGVHRGGSTVRLLASSSSVTPLSCPSPAPADDTGPGRVRGQGKWGNSLGLRWKRQAERLGERSKGVVLKRCRSDHVRKGRELRSRMLQLLNADPIPIGADNKACSVAETQVLVACLRWPQMPTLRPCAGDTLTS